MYQQDEQKILKIKARYYLGQMPILEIILCNGSLEGRSVEFVEPYFSHKRDATESDRTWISKIGLLKIVSKAVGLRFNAIANWIYKEQKRAGCRSWAAAILIFLGGPNL